MLLIGSRAAAHWHPECRVRERSDWDIIATHAEVEAVVEQDFDPSRHSWKWSDIEFHNAAFLCNAEMEEYADNGPGLVMHRSLNRIEAKICDSRGLAIIKRSHLHRKIKFMHHMMQYQYLDHNFNVYDLDLLEKRTAATKAAFPDRVGSKNKTNEEFFKDAVTRHLPHDEIHKIVAYYNEPMYLRVKRDASRAAYDFDLFNALSLTDKHRVVSEECYVIALERFLIPPMLAGQRYPYRFAFSKALEKACTTLDDGPFREHAIDYWHVIRRCDDGVFTNFFNSKLWKNYVSKAATSV